MCSERSEGGSRAMIQGNGDKYYMSQRCGVLL